MKKTIKHLKQIPATVHVVAEQAPMENELPHKRLSRLTTEQGRLTKEIQKLMWMPRADDQDTLIDGRARLEVGLAITLDPPIIRHDPSDALNYVLTTNYYRKHLTDEEKQDFMDRVRQIREK